MPTHKSLRDVVPAMRRGEQVQVERDAEGNVLGVSVEGEEPESAVIADVPPVVTGPRVRPRPANNEAALVDLPKKPKKA